MELFILDTGFETLKIIDKFESLLWTIRYSSYGDFELYTVVDLEELPFFKKGYYVWIRETNRYMFIEKIEISSDVEDGAHLKVTGRSLESILNRRINYTETNYSGNLQAGIKKLLNDNIISPTDYASYRRISNFIFKDSTDPNITSLTLETKFERGMNIGEAVQKICDAEDLGYRITLSETKQFVFELYKGTDRSYDQFEVPYVIFSPKFDNIINSEYVDTDEDFKNVVFVYSERQEEGVTYTNKREVYGKHSLVTGLRRREMYLDFSGSNDENSGTSLTNQMKQAGKEALSEYQIQTAFEGQVDATLMFRFEEDFFMGDVVQIANEYGIESKSRVTEILWSQTNQGLEVYPTFTTVD